MPEPLPPDPFDPACPSTVTPFQISDKRAGMVLTSLHAATDLGRSLFPAMDACSARAREHRPAVEPARAAYAQRRP
ncbi:hypothetical protein [Dactylosporangium sp. CA-092794]|uniref:hypothetical protein n=1 Tax=Dactylosporangium sp. CA-092794 TaxID=3239929 RepID=UPI003D8E8664